jgi:hypothetical protein
MRVVRVRGWRHLSRARDFVAFAHGPAHADIAAARGPTHPIGDPNKAPSSEIAFLNYHADQPHFTLICVKQI